MPKPKRDVEERPTVRSMLTSAAAALVDHRVLFQLAVVCLVVLVLRVFGPDEIGRGLDYVVTSVPAQFVGRALIGARGLAIGGLQKVNDATGAIDGASVDTLSAAGSSQPALVADRATSGSGTRADRPQPVRSIDGTPDNARGIRPPPEGFAASGIPVGATGTSDAPETVAWWLVKDEETLRAELHGQRSGAVDLVVFKNGRLWRHERWADRAAARAEADRKRADLEKSGWRRSDCCGPPGVPDF